MIILDEFNQYFKKTHDGTSESEVNILFKSETKFKVFKLDIKNYKKSHECYIIWFNYMMN